MRTPLDRIRFGAISLATVFILSIAGFRFLGGYSWLEATWLVVVTISTVGFGENTESEPGMQLFTIGVIVFGVSAAVYSCGGFIQLLLEGEVQKVMGRRKVSREISRMDDHVIICGFGRLGQDLAVQLKHRNIPFVVIDLNPEKIQQIEENGYLAIQGDATQEEVLMECGFTRARAIATVLPSDAENVFITLTARNLRDDIQIISKSEQESSCGKLRQAGADKIVMPHRIGAQQMERMISRPTTADLVELFAEATHLEMELDELLVTESSPLAGSTLEKSGLKDKFNVLVVGIKDHTGEFRFNPSPRQELLPNDTLLVIGQLEDINQLKQTWTK